MLYSRAIAALALLARAGAFASVPTGVSQCKVLEGQEYSNQQLEGINEGDNFADTIPGGLSAPQVGVEACDRLLPKCKLFVQRDHL